MDLIKWLEQFYLSNCNGDWEHMFGVKIDTLDNPGWFLQFEIAETEYEDCIFEDIKDYRTDDDWIACKKENNVITCACGPENLGEVLGIVKNWTERNGWQANGGSIHNQ